MAGFTRLTCVMLKNMKLPEIKHDPDNLPCAILARRFIEQSGMSTEQFIEWINNLESNEGKTNENNPV